MMLLKLVFTFLFFGFVHAEHKTAREVFHKWFVYQQVYQDRSLANLARNLGNSYWQNFCQTYQTSQVPLTGIDVFCQKAFDPGVLSHADHVTARANRALKGVIKLLDTNPEKFFVYLKENGLLNAEVNQQEQEIHFNDVIDKNKTFLGMLLYHENNRIRDEYHFAFANRLFEYCFSPDTFHKFFAMLNDPSQHQINRFCYSTLWYNLVGDGWKHWHVDCLKALASQTRKGKEVVYIAGGNDIHEPLRHGVYNIRVIDPMLPSQDEYYAEGVEWLIKGGGANNGLGDTFEVPCAKMTLLLKRSNYQENGTFYASLSTGKTITLPQSVTTWVVSNKDTGKKLGNVLFERRYCAQHDFAKDKNKVLLASFNELYYVGAQPRLGGWGMDVAAFDKNLMCYVKQLRKPLSKSVMQNLYKTDEASLSFISLGSDPT